MVHKSRYAHSRCRRGSNRALHRDRLARRGHEVTAIDRDPGPDGDESWNRKGVMQFHHPHAFRQQIGEALLAEMPEVWDGLIAAGAEPVTLPDQPDQSRQMVLLRCRRLTFERILRRAAEAEPGVTLRIGHVDEVCCKQGRAVGVRVDGHQVDANLVLDASGRLIRRWSGHDVDLSRPLPSDLITAATAVDPEMLTVVGPYLGMLALLASLAAVEPRAREIYTGGWRPPVPEGPTRDELAELITGWSRPAAGSHAPDSTGSRSEL